MEVFAKKKEDNFTNKEEFIKSMREEREAMESKVEKAR
jgi:hypothetical protein